MVNDELGIYYSKFKNIIFKLSGAKTWTIFFQRYAKIRETEPDFWRSLLGK
jgi:hypothetical protein